MNKHMVFAIAALALATPALAQQAPKPIARGEYLAANQKRFALIDTNHDGKIDRGEMAAAQQLAAKFRELDTNKDGKLSLPEFQATAAALRTAETPDQILAKLDTNRNGSVDANEFRAPDVAKFNRADANRDGVVTPAEARAAAVQK